MSEPKETTRPELDALIAMYRRDHNGEMPGVIEIMQMREAIASVAMSHDDEVGTVEITADSAFIAHPGDDNTEP